MIISAHPASPGGAFRDRHERGGGMWWACRVAAWSITPTNNPMRTAKPCGP